MASTRVIVSDRHPDAAELPRPDREGSVLSTSRKGFHRIAYVEWGDARSQRVAVCVHGLTRQGRDFDRVAMALVRQGWRVVCPDLVGRGRSDWLKDSGEYALPQYVVDLTTVIARLGVETVDWVGTSLGGLIGVVMAGQDRSPIRSLVVNDIGPFLPWQALHRIGSSLQHAPQEFPSFAAADLHFRTTLAPFGALGADEWAHLTRHSIEPHGNRWRRLCDPGVAQAFRTGLFYNLSLWTYWDAVRCPTLVLRGATSDLLLPETAMEMHRRGPKADLVEFPDCGHAPALLDPVQIGTVTRWMQRQAATAG